MNWQDIHLLGFMASPTGLIWVVIGELLTHAQPNIFTYVGLIQCSIGGVMCIVGAIKGGCPF